VHGNGYIEILLLVAAYIAFVSFFNREGARFFRTQTEVRLAGEIHRAMSHRNTRPSATSSSRTAIPSKRSRRRSLDIVETGPTGTPTADVSGHGVAAGILMSMIKSTAAMQLTKLNKPPNSSPTSTTHAPPHFDRNYLTFAYVSGSMPKTQLRIGRTPSILHYQA